MNNKLNSTYKIKSHSLEIKDVDAKSRKVAMYLAHFGNIDSDDDVIRKGAFAKSLLERGVDSPSNRKIQYLRHHDWKWQIGVFTELIEDDNGLYAVGELSKSTQGNDALVDYQLRVIREHSIGFKYIADKINWTEDKSLPNGGFYDVKEVALWEGSAVTFGANEMTPVLEVGKSEDKSKIITTITKEMDIIVKALSGGSGSYSDDKLYSFEMRHKFLTSQLSEIASLNVEALDVKKIIEPTEEEKSFDWSKVVTNIK
jgi:HK97 family phage prohead protease